MIETHNVTVLRFSRQSDVIKVVFLLVIPVPSKIGQRKSVLIRMLMKEVLVGHR